MRLKLLLIIILFLSLTRVMAQTLPNTNQTAEKGKIERLVGLAKIWGAVKYFHPFLAYRKIDWDKALIDTIPRVNAAKTPQEYEAAINSMLAALGDKATRAQIGPNVSKTENQTPTTKEPVSIENGVLLINALTVAKVFQQEANRRAEITTKTNELIPQAKAVLIDLRHAGADGEDDLGYFLNIYWQSLLPVLLDRDVLLASLRYRLYNGYVPQTGSTSGGYYSGMMTVTPEILTGNNKAKMPPIVFITDENSPTTKIIGGLQTANLAFAVQDGETVGDAGAVTTTLRLPENVEVKMRIAELVNPDGNIGFSPDQIVPKGEAMQAAKRLITENKFISNRTKNASVLAAQVIQKEKTYAEMEFPSPEYRLLALFRFWNVINYFFPYSVKTLSNSLKKSG